jgi:hypothetical protein
MEVSFNITLRPLYSQGKGSRYPSDRSLSGLQSQSGPCDEEKNIPDRAGNQNRPSKH